MDFGDDRGPQASAWKKHLGLVLPLSASVFQSMPVAGAISAATFGGLVMLARTVFGKIADNREAQLQDLAGRLETMVAESVAASPDRIEAISPRTLPAGGATATAP